MRLLLDQSAHISNINESHLLQNLNTSQLEGHNFLNRSNEKIFRHTPAAVENLDATENLNLIQIEQLEAANQESFTEFGYAKPPVAEMQVLRALETRLLR